MAGEQMTEREAALAARVKELESAQAKGAATTAEGGALESVWRRVADIVPSSLVAAGLAVLVAHYGFGYYLQSQVTAAETQLKEAKAKLETAKSMSANSPDAQGVTLRLQTLKAEIDNKRADAAAAKAKATALNAEINGESAALAAAKANLDNLQQQARLVQARAEALSKDTGYGTLAQKEAVLKVMKAELLAAKGRWKQAVLGDGATVRALCADNQFAEELKCPAQYVKENQRNKAKDEGTPQPAPAKPAQVATAPSDDNGNYWKPAPSCALTLQQFQTYNSATIHGVFAVTKIAKGGGCGWSSSTKGKPMEVMRREALARCAGYGADCKIISER
jgi:DNA repair exonuclease SbcCD ATPase subunit